MPERLRRTLVTMGCLVLVFGMFINSLPGTVQDRFFNIYPGWVFNIVSMRGGGWGMYQQRADYADPLHYEYVFGNGTVRDMDSPYGFEASMHRTLHGNFDVFVANGSQATVQAVAAYYCRQPDVPKDIQDANSGVAQVIIQRMVMAMPKLETEPHVAFTPFTQTIAKQDCK